MEKTILMNRRENIPWGFRLQGGSDCNHPLSVKLISPNSLADTSGLKKEDCIIAVNGLRVDGLTHIQVLEHIKSCGNSLILSIKRCDLSPSSSNKRSVLELSLLQPEAVLLKSPSSASQSRKFSPCSPVIQNTAKGWESSSPGSRFPASSPLKPNLRVFQTSFSNKVSQDSTIHPDIAASRPHTYTSTSGFREKYSTQANMNGASHSSQDEVPDQILNQFATNKRPEDKPFSYIPTGGIEELQHKQREIKAPPVKPKPRVLNKQTSQTGSANSQNNYDPSSLFTPAYLEMLKNQQEQLSQPSEMFPAEKVGFGPDKVPHDDVAAYILQPDGTMAALRWNDRPGPDLRNSAVMAALVEEQNAQERGRSTGRIHNANSGSKQGLSFKVLQWLTGTDSEDGSETTSNYSGSHDGHSSMGQRLRHQSFDSTKFPEQIREDDNGSDFNCLYNGSNLPSKSFRRLLRSMSSTASTEELSSLPSPQQESPSDSEEKQPRHSIKLVGRGSSHENISRPPAPIPERVAYCDF
ncbi:SYNPO2L [Bugula neritina]|uniref:SYNPO2L n=1 Tax=Bugula neritina TaxID=10212 RepID=A0A7J7KQ77_BUGNE|nr:SYNPO2L [Bugula neritina]